MLSAIESLLGTTVRVGWSQAKRELADRVALFRNYEDGKHRAELSTDMQKMLRIADRLTFDQFNMNYCELIVEKFSDRLRVLDIDVRARDGGDGGSLLHRWLDDVREYNRFDELQVDVHTASIRDADSYLIAEWSNEDQTVRWSFEPAYDSDTQTGMIVVYDRQRRHVVTAIKIWDEASTKFNDGKRVNFYYADRIMKYVTSDGGGALYPFRDSTTDENGVVWWTENRLPSGVTIGLPVFHFRNRKSGRTEYGKSELTPAIPLQDAINRTLVSMVMTAELTGFGMWFAKGHTPDSAVAPGKIIVADFVDAQGRDMIGDASQASAWASYLSGIDMKLLEQAQLTPFLDQLTQLIDRMMEITRTPIPSQMGSNNQSGEALKERQTGMIEKVERVQTTFGNVWEDVAKFSLKLGRVFGGLSIPDGLVYDCRWKPAQMRNDADVLNAATIMQAAGYEKEFLRLVGKMPYLNYDENKIISLEDEKLSSNAEQIRQLALPGFGSMAS